MDSPHTPHHRLAVQARIGVLTLDADLPLHADWTLLFGPSGSGKSSLLRAACGLLPAAAITFTRHSPVDPGATPTTLQSSTTFIPPEQRSLGWAPQQPALFPHLTVLENIEFAHRSHPSPAGPSLVSEALTLFRLDPLGRRLPAQLSGGESQRVNLARAYARPDCRLLLLDEPFAGIDRTLRDQILPDLRSALCRRGIPVLSVSHDVEEAFLLDCEVILLRDGRIHDRGPAATVLAPERDGLLRSLTPDTSR